MVTTTALFFSVTCHVHSCLADMEPLGSGLAPPPQDKPFSAFFVCPYLKVYPTENFATLLYTSILLFPASSDESPWS